MLWSLTCWNHKLSTTRLVRWWLRMTVLDRLIIVVIVNILHIIISFFVLMFWLANRLAHSLLMATTENFLSQYLNMEQEATVGIRFVLGFMNFISGTTIFFEVVLTIVVWAFSIFFIVDLIWDGIVTRSVLRNFASKPDIILSTRGEYVGGHPELPDSRFIYLTIGGRKESPNLSLVLPGLQGKEFNIPLIDITSTKSGIDEKFGQPGGFNIWLTSITPSVWKGHRSVLNVEYTNSGRKYLVETGSFLRGNDEVQKWKNYLTCAQAEADTGIKPYGNWKSLPEDDRKEAENETSQESN
jgi:hypothetical protein